MATKTIKTRTIQNIATSSEWDAVKTTFMPLIGELIIYSDINNMKIGDGVKVLDELSFLLPTDAIATETFVTNAINNAINDSWEQSY